MTTEEYLGRKRQYESLTAEFYAQLNNTTYDPHKAQRKLYLALILSGLGLMLMSRGPLWPAGLTGVSIGLALRVTVQSVAERKRLKAVVNEHMLKLQALDREIFQELEEDCQ